MGKKTLLIVMGAALAATMSCVGAKTDDDQTNDAVAQATLRAMNDASTWYHPDLFGEFNGMRHYTRHEYADAMKNFKVGAYYADKLSQLSIGLMYLNGEGVEKDPATAYAWLDIAAEREYPDFVATRDRVKASLTPEQSQQGQAMRDELATHYADAVAKPRMVHQLQMGLSQMTGSRLGSSANVLHPPSKMGCRGPVYVGNVKVPESGCGGDEIYAESRWKPEKYFARRDSQWKATVTVGAIESDGQTPKIDQKPAATDANKPLGDKKP
jgi:hypothetical protein